MKHIKKFKLNENPDVINYKGKKISYQGGWAFGYQDGDFLFGRSTHGALVTRHKQLGASFGTRFSMEYPGRAWLEAKVLSFWEYPEPKLLKEIIEILEDKFGTYMDDWEIEIPMSEDGEMERYDSSDGDMDWSSNHKTIFIPLSDYDKYYNKMNKTNVGIEIPHLMNPIEKQEFYKKHGKAKGFGSDLKAKKNPIEWEQAKRTSENVLTYEDYLILEGRKEDVLEKFIKEYGDLFGVALYNSDDTENKAYIEWLLSFCKKNEKELGIDKIKGKFNKYEDIEKYPQANKIVTLIRSLIKKYDDNKKDLSTPITKIKTIKQLREALDEKRNLKELYNYPEDDVKIWYDDLEWIVFQAYTYEVAEYANSRERDKDPKGSNWCTTYGEGHFDQHLGKKGGILYCVNKLDYKEDRAFEFKPNSTDVRVWNWKDQSDDIQKYEMKDEFDEDSKIYEVFDETIQDEIEDIELSREDLEQKVRQWYEDMGPYETITSYDILQELDKNDFVEKFIEGEIDYYSDSFVDFVDAWQQDVMDYLLDEDLLYEMLDFYELPEDTDKDVLYDKIDEEGGKKLTEFVSNRNLERDIVTKLLNDRYSGYDASDMVNDFYGDPDRMSVKDFEDYYGNFFDIDDVFINYVDNMIDESSDDDLFEIIGEW